jgi:adenylate cyclase
MLLDVKRLALLLWNCRFPPHRPCYSLGTPVFEPYGTLQREGDRLRVSLNLLQVESGRSLWTDRFETIFSDLFAVQDEIARQVTSRLRSEFSSTAQTRRAKRETSSPQAYEYYLKGIYSKELWRSSRANVEDAIAKFKKAIEIDPS